VIGECLMNLLEDHGADFDRLTTREFWQQALRARRQLVMKLQALVEWQAKKSEEPPLLGRARRALVAANEVNKDTTAEDLDGYVQALHSDQVGWSGHLTALVTAAGPSPDPRPILANLQSGKPPARNWQPAEVC
jgi:hypothetical protein